MSADGRAADARAVIERAMPTERECAIIAAERRGNGTVTCRAWRATLLRYAAQQIVEICVIKTCRWLR